MSPTETLPRLGTAGHLGYPGVLWSRPRRSWFYRLRVSYPPSTRRATKPGEMFEDCCGKRQVQRAGLKSGVDPLSAFGSWWGETFPTWLGLPPTATCTPRTLARDRHSTTTTSLPVHGLCRSANSPSQAFPWCYQLLLKHTCCYNGLPIYNRLTINGALAG
jgi:hypothetical protein